MLNLVIIGGEGNGGVIASVIESGDYVGEKIALLGFLNDEECEVAGYPVLGKVGEWNRLPEDTKFIWAIHTIGRNLLIERAYSKADIPEHRLLSVVHQDSFVAESAVIGKGVFVMRGCYVGPRADLGSSSMLMANVCFGHDSSCGVCCHFSVGAIVSSYVDIGNYADVTLGARVIEKVRIGDFGVVGSCALATREVERGAIVLGVPARFHRFIDNWGQKEK